MSRLDFAQNIDVVRSIINSKSSVSRCVACRKSKGSDDLLKLVATILEEQGRTKGCVRSVLTLAGLLLSQALSRNSSDRAQLFDCFKAQSITNCADGCYFEVWLMLTTTLVVDSRAFMQAVYTLHSPLA